MISNQNNYLDKNHQSIAMTKTPYRKNGRQMRMQSNVGVQQALSSELRKQHRTVTFCGVDDVEHSRGHHEIAQMPPTAPAPSTATSTSSPSSNVQCKQSRIPMSTMMTTTPTSTRNFNQILKVPPQTTSDSAFTSNNTTSTTSTTTNLWHEIYERHLLNQTKFERIQCTVDDKWANKSVSNVVRKTHSQRETALGVNGVLPPEIKFNNNNLYRPNEVQQAILAISRAAQQSNYESHITPFALLRRQQLQQQQHQQQQLHLIDPQMTFAESNLLAPQKRNVKLRLANRSSIVTTESANQLHKQIKYFEPNGLGAASALFTPSDGKTVSNKNAVAFSNDLHLFPPPQQHQQQQQTNVRYQPYAYSSDWPQISNEMGIVYMQSPSIIEKKQHFYQQQQPKLHQPSFIPYNGHGKQTKGENNNDITTTADCQLYKSNGAGALNQAYNRISGNICLERGQPVGGNHREEDSSAQGSHAVFNGIGSGALPILATTTTATTTAAATTIASTALASSAKSASLSVVSAVNAKAQCSTFENAITASSGGGGGGTVGDSTLATNSEYTTNSKINIMLETAQAMAAAAHFARLVHYTYTHIHTYRFHFFLHTQ